MHLRKQPDCAIGGKVFIYGETLKPMGERKRVQSINFRVKASKYTGIFTLNCNLMRNCPADTFILTMKNSQVSS